MITIESKSLSEQSKELLSYLGKSDKPLLTINLGQAAIQLSELDQIIGTIDDEQGRKSAVCKRDILEYYIRIAPYLLPILKDRPLTVKRFQNGLEQPGELLRHFAQAPQFINQIELFSEYSGDNESFLLCQNLASLLWLINQNVIEFYPWHARINPETTDLPTIFINSIGTLEMSVANYPDWLSLKVSNHDMENSNPIDSAAWVHLQKAANLVHTYFERHQLHSYVKYDGEGGLDIIMPIERRYTFEKVRTVAQRYSQQITSLYSDQFAAGWEINQRSGKVLIEPTYNARNRATIAGYSLKVINDNFTVALPIDWKTLMLAYPQQFRFSHFIAHSVDANMHLHTLPSSTGQLAAEELPLDVQRSSQYQIGSHDVIHHTWRYLFKKPQLLPEQLES